MGGGVLYNFIFTELAFKTVSVDVTAFHRIVHNLCGTRGLQRAPKLPDAILGITCECVSAPLQHCNKLFISQSFFNPLVFIHHLVPIHFLWTRLRHIIH